MMWTYSKQNENRLILASIVKCVLFLGEQNIAFRGNDDDGLPGKHLDRHQKNATYMGADIQNELINICANSIRKYLQGVPKVLIT